MLQLLSCSATSLFSVNVCLSDSPTVKENTQASPKRPQSASIIAATPKVPSSLVQQESDEEDQETDDEFLDSDKTSQTGLSGKITRREMGGGGGGG